MFDAARTLREARLAAGLTQAQLAARLGVSQSTVAGWERPGANPTVRTLDRALAATGRRLGAPVSTARLVDESQIVERLRLTPAQRLAAFQTSQRNLRRLAMGARRVVR